MIYNNTKLGERLFQKGLEYLQKGENIGAINCLFEAKKYYLSDFYKKGTQDTHNMVWATQSLIEEAFGKVRNENGKYKSGHTETDEIFLLEQMILTPENRRNFVLPQKRID